MASANTLPAMGGGVQLEAGAFARSPAPVPSLFDRLPPPLRSPLSRRTAPWLASVGVVGLAALSWATLSQPEQKALFSGLGEADKAAVADALDSGGIDWSLNEGTGAIAVATDDFYRARMLAASQNVPKAAASSTDILDTIPMGSSRPVEAERLRQSRERELALSVQEIDGIDVARVHLAEAERSLFVREAAPTRASVFVTVARGRRLGEEQVAAIVNLLSGSVSGLTPDNVNVVDQHGRLLSRPTGDSGLADRIDYQARLEDKLREQLGQLLAPMFGPGNYTVEVQAEIDLTEASSARESYDKDKVLERERSESSTDPAVGGYGIPGATSNVPPPASQVANGPPVSSAPAPEPGATGSQSADRNYAVGRELSVAKAAPGGLKRLSVAVVLSESAGKRKLGPQDVAQVERLVRSAAGIDDARGDQVSVVARAFAQVETPEEPPFWQADWFLPLVRQVGAVLVALLIVLFGFRPLMARLRRTKVADATPTSEVLPAVSHGPAGDLTLDEQLAFARTMAEGSPERVAAALRSMLRPGAAEPA